MLTIATTDPSNTQAKLKTIIDTPRHTGKSWAAKTITNTPSSISPHQLDEIYQEMHVAGIDLNDPRLNVRNAYIRHLERLNADLKTQINDIQGELTQSNRVIFELLASFMVFASIAITFLVWVAI